VPTPGQARKGQKHNCIKKRIRKRDIQIERKNATREREDMNRDQEEDRERKRETRSTLT
jgi:hypothetical protein